MTLLYVNDDDENPAGSDTTLRDAPRRAGCVSTPTAPDGGR
jgi:hypothetical protein